MHPREVRVLVEKHKSTIGPDLCRVLIEMADDQYQLQKDVQEMARQMLNVVNVTAANVAVADKMRQLGEKLAGKEKQGVVVSSEPVSDN